MFCPKCGKELPENAAFCGGCGNKIGGTVNSQPEAAPVQNPAPVYAAPAAAAPAPSAPAKKIGAAIMIVVLLIASILPIIFWFCDNVGVDIDIMGQSLSETASWNEVYEGDDDDMMILNVIRGVSIGFLAINILIAVLVLAKGKYNKKRTRFIFARFAAIISAAGATLFHIDFAESAPSMMKDYIITTFSGVMYFVCCAILFVLPIFISHMTKVPKKK